MRQSARSDVSRLQLMKRGLGILYPGTDGGLEFPVLGQTTWNLNCKSKHAEVLNGWLQAVRKMKIMKHANSFDGVASDEIGMSTEIPKGIRQSPTFHMDNWYALYTRHQHEKTIALHLDKLGFQVFLPMYREVHQWKDRCKIVDLPLFPSYVLFSGDLNRRIEILNVPGVYFLLNFEGKAAAIPRAELDSVCRALESKLPIEPCPFVKSGERVRVYAGPLAGVEGVVARRRDSLRLILSVETLCRSVAVEVDEAHVGPIAWAA